MNNIPMTDELNNTQRTFSLLKKRRDKGAFLMDMGLAGILGLVLLGTVVTYFVTAMMRSDSGTEVSNIMSMTTSAKGMLKGPTGYGTPGLDLMPIMISAGQIPKSMTVIGEDVQNSWGGAVTMKVGTNANSFYIASTNIPKDACIAIVTSVAGSAGVNLIDVSAGGAGKEGGTESTDITPAKAAELCTVDKSSSSGTGGNTISFTVIG